MRYLLIPALLVAMAAPAAAAGVKLEATLAGANEVGGGDPDGTGRFSAEMDVDGGKLCYTLTADKIAQATAAHIHTGVAGTNGPPVVTLSLAGGAEKLCAAVDSAALKPIAANPAGYYVNVHNAEFPAGAVRGQLEKK